MDSSRNRGQAGNSERRGRRQAMGAGAVKEFARAFGQKLFTEILAGRQGLEPRYADPESAVLPLDDLPEGLILTLAGAAPRDAVSLLRPPRDGGLRSTGTA